MTTFILILSVIGGCGISVTSVPGFAAQAECQAAGTAWETVQKHGLHNFVCVAQTK
jgi:hypothetical protein